jgi:DNA-directed RNA polymerase subunit RPC12/RpoP
MSREERRERQKRERRERKTKEKNERQRKEKNKHFITILCSKCKTEFDVDRKHPSVVFKLYGCTNCGHENKWDIQHDGGLKAGSFRQRMQKPMLQGVLAVGILVLFMAVVSAWIHDGAGTGGWLAVLLISSFLLPYCYKRFCMDCRKFNAMRITERRDHGNSWETLFECKHCGRNNISRVNKTRDHY